MLLLDGITGFSDKSDILPLVDRNEFNKLCYSLAIYMNGKVKSFTGSQTNTNFYVNTLNISGETTHILLNDCYPFIAFATSVDYCGISFVNKPDFSKILREFSTDLKFLTTSELHETIQVDGKTFKLKNENSLNPVELSQILYWKPKTIGEVIFNYWD